MASATDVESLCAQTWGIGGQPIREEIVSQFLSPYSFRVRRSSTGEVLCSETLPVFWSTDLPLEAILLKLKNLGIEYRTSGLNPYKSLTFSKDFLKYEMSFVEGKCCAHSFAVVEYELQYSRTYASPLWYSKEGDYEFFDFEGDIKPLLKPLKTPFA